MEIARAYDPLALQGVTFPKHTYTITFDERLGDQIGCIDFIGTKPKIEQAACHQITNCRRTRGFRTLSTRQGRRFRYLAITRGMKLRPRAAELATFIEPVPTSRIRAAACRNLSRPAWAACTSR